MDVLELISSSESMTDAEREELRDMVPLLSKAKREELASILRRESQAYREAEARFSPEVILIESDLDAKERHLLEGKRIADSISKK